MSNTIKTIEKFSEFKLKEKGSVFIAQVYHVEDEEEVQRELEKVRKKYYDATHHCYAFQLLNGTEKYSDDGEPAGTAGIRILSAIKHFEAVNILLIVIRYFGGTKLGVGPLGKAYYNSAFELLQNSQIVEKKNYVKLKIFFEYELTNKVHFALSKFKAKKIKNKYEKTPVIVCYIEADKTESFIKHLIETTGNKVEVQTSEQTFLL